MDDDRHLIVTLPTLALTLLLASPGTLAAAGAVEDGGIASDSSPAERTYIAVRAPVACPGVVLDAVLPFAPGRACFTVDPGQEVNVTLEDQASWLVSGTLRFYDLALSPVGDPVAFCHQTNETIPADAGFLEVAVHGALETGQGSACPGDAGGPATAGTITVAS